MLGSALLGLAGALAASEPSAAPVPTRTDAPVATLPDAGTPGRFPGADAELLALDDEMRHFFSKRIDAHAGPQIRLSQLMAALIGEDGLHLTYATEANYSAGETFHRRQANCLAFSLLAVAVARTYGLTASFCEVDTYPRWDRFGHIITEIRHLNVQIRAGPVRYELDLRPWDERRTSAGKARVVTDARAFAHFYNNLGVFRQSAGAVTEAQTLFDRALAADPTAAFVWANEGAALLLAGDTAAAQQCLERAVRENPRDLAALSSLADVYHRTGRPEPAARLDQKVQRYRLRNPYYLNLLAQQACAQGRYLEAEKHLRRAIAIKDDEPEFYELRLRVAQNLGRAADAQRWAAKLQNLRKSEAQASAGAIGGVADPSAQTSPSPP